MIETTDGTFAQGALEKMPAAEAQRLRDVIQKAAHVGIEGAAQTVFFAFPHEAQQLAAALTDETLEALLYTALDAAVKVYLDETPREVAHPSVAAAAVAGAIGASAAGISVGKVRGELYRAGSVLGDVEAVASGNPARMVRRVEQHVFWRTFGRFGRSIFRGLGGKR